MARCHDCGAPAAAKENGFYRRCEEHRTQHSLKQHEKRRRRLRPAHNDPESARTDTNETSVSLRHTVQQEQTLTQTQSFSNRVSRVRHLPDGSVQTEEQQFTVCVSQQLAQRITLSVQQKYSELLTQRLHGALLPGALDHYRQRVRDCSLDLLSLNLKDAWEFLSQRTQAECREESQQTQTRLDEWQTHLQHGPCALPSAEEYQVRKRLRTHQAHHGDWAWLKRAKQSLALWYLEPLLARSVPADMTIRCLAIAEEERCLPFGFTQQPQPLDVPPDHDIHASVFVGLCQVSDDSTTVCNVPVDLALCQGRPETALTEELVERWKRPLLDTPPEELYPAGFAEAQAINTAVFRLQPRPRLALSDVVALNAVATRYWCVRQEFQDLQEQYESLPLAVRDIVEPQEWRRLEGYVCAHEPLWTLRHGPVPDSPVEIEPERTVAAAF